MTVNNSYLLGLYGSSSSSAGSNLLSALYPSAASSSTSSSAASTAAAQAAGPTPPWKQASTPNTALVQNALNGRQFINTASAQLNVVGANSQANSDYRSLFGLYQGLNTLSALAQQAQQAGNTTGQVQQLQQAFSSGLSQVESFLQADNFKQLNIVQGQVASTLTSGAGVAESSSKYVGHNIVSGSSATAAPAFEGDVQFSASIATSGGATKVVNFNLADLGSQTRSLTNVVNYLNSQLAAAGVETRFATQRTAGTPSTSTVDGQTATLTTTPDQFALVLNGASNETVTLSAPATADALYVAQGAGPNPSTAPATTSTSSTPPTPATPQLLKFQTNAVDGGTAPPAALAQPSDTFTTAGEAWQQNLPPGVTSIQGTASASDGSVYVLADVSGAVSGQTVSGSSDVALLKYDSAGKLQFTQTLGASATGSGYGLAVSSDGSQIAVTGTVTGGLAAAGSTADATTPNSFVAVFNSTGAEQWAQITPAASGDQANAVTFGPDGSVYVAGQTSSPILGSNATQQGQTEAYVQGFTSTGVSKFTQEFGTTGVNSATTLAVNGTSLLVGGVLNGQGVVNSYSLPAKGAPVLQTSRNLGNLQGGSVTGLAVSNGQVIVAGTTHNPALNAGTITAAAGTGSNAFVASLNANLAPSASDSVAYYAGQGNTTATALSVVNGDVYIAGNTGPKITAAGTTETGQGGYLAQVNPTTGAVGWSTALNGPDGIAAPVSISAASGGASVLDQLGLPSGTISQTATDLVTAATPVKSGSSFYIQAYAGAPLTQVTVTATDTLQTLATKIAEASNNALTVTVLPSSSKEKLTIKATGSVNAVQILAGPSGSNALTGLGLNAGLVEAAPSTTSSKTTNLNFGLDLPATLDISSVTDAKQAFSQIQASISILESAYQALVTANTPASVLAAQKLAAAENGPVPAYLSAQLANYSAGLARLG